MEQQYRPINVGTDIRQEGDEVFYDGEWRPIGKMYGVAYTNHWGTDTSLAYRRPIPPPAATGTCDETVEDEQEPTGTVVRGLPPIPEGFGPPEYGPYTVGNVILNGSDEWILVAGHPHALACVHCKPRPKPWRLEDQQLPCDVLLRNGEVATVRCDIRDWGCKGTYTHIGHKRAGVSGLMWTEDGKYLSAGDSELDIIGPAPPE